MAKRVDVRTLRKTLRRLRDIGYSYRQIAYLTGVSYATVVNYLKGYKPKYDYQPVDKKLEKKIIYAYNKNKSVSVIALVFNVRASDVLRIIKKHLEEQNASNSRR